MSRRTRSAHGSSDTRTSRTHLAPLALGPTRSSGTARPTGRRPSLLLWRHRHLVVALCLGAAVVLALGVLRPGPTGGREVYVVSRHVDAGRLLTEDDVELRSLPAEALPSEGLADAGVVGSRAAISLEKGTVLTTSMTGAAAAAGLSQDERLVQVPIDVGAQLAEPGARVDVVGEAVAAPTGADGTGGSGDIGGDGGASGVGTPGDGGDASGSASAPLTTPGTTVLCHQARVVSTIVDGEDKMWHAGTKVTIVTLVVPVTDASLIVGAATNGALGIVLSP